MQNRLIIIAFIVISLNAIAQPRWSFELQSGEVYNLPMPLKINQQGYADLQLTARYFTEPFNSPVYYDGRISRWEDDRSWELEFIHHKLYMDNTTEEIQKFNISHGFNLLMVNRGFDHQTYRYRAGAGVVITHPESQIRDLTFGNSDKDNDMGYFLSGPVMQISVNKPYYIGQRFYINAEAKTTLAYASVKIARGRADVYNIAFHLVLGVGVEGRK